MTRDDAPTPGPSNRDVPESAAPPEPGARRPPPLARVGATWLLIGMIAGIGLLAVLRTASGGSSPGTAGQSPVEQRAVGLVTTIDARSVVDVRSFTLRTDTGTTMTFVLVPGVNTGFPPAHLEEHRASGEQVLVTYHLDAGRNLVDHLDDAPAASASPTASS